MPAFRGTPIFLVYGYKEHVIENSPFLTLSVMPRLVVYRKALHTDMQNISKVLAFQNQATLGLVDWVTFKTPFGWVWLTCIYERRRGCIRGQTSLGVWFSTNAPLAGVDSISQLSGLCQNGRYGRHFAASITFQIMPHSHPYARQNADQSRFSGIWCFAPMSDVNISGTLTFGSRVRKLSSTESHDSVPLNI